nr:MAG TPA: hypothetical protein [Caudoviricetes sp.]
MTVKPRCTRTVVFVCPFLARCSLHRAFIAPSFAPLIKAISR